MTDRMAALSPLLHDGVENGDASAKARCGFLGINSRTGEGDWRNPMPDLPVGVEILRREVVFLTREGDFGVGGFDVGCRGL